KGLNPTNKKESINRQTSINGVVHHALAFNTLLSSQETHASILALILSNRNSEASFCLLHFIRRPISPSNPEV
ncbi:hypothetical protein, partial [Nonomuraea sp. KM88]|uniref:hypothetical protein n=1 Tax=Nonomuraea sp. KM88 TaxID=3457427 RepID=UPI003FCC58CD